MSVEVSDNELEEMYNLAIRVAEKAGEMIFKGFTSEKKTETKESAADLVTETDCEVEREACQLLLAKYPKHRFIGEETQAKTGGHCEWTDDPTWIMDPVDGTTNFVHSVPDVCFSLALTVNKKPVIGIVHLPMKGEMFSALVGHGARLNGKNLHPSKVTEMSTSLGIVEAGSSRDPVVLTAKMRNIQTVVAHSHGIRSYGSAAANMCYVASGRGDFYFEYGIHIWDIIAAALIAQEAGATICDPNGGEVDYLARRILCACTPQLAEQVSVKLTHLEMERD